MKYQFIRQNGKKKPKTQDRTVPKLDLVICTKFQNDCIRNIIFSLSVEKHYFSLG